MSRFQGKRNTMQQVMKISAKPDFVFSLLCPEREKAWIDGWEYEMIYSQSGFAEKGCTFKTELQPEGEAYWLMTRCVPPYEAEYVRFVIGKMFVTLSFKLSEEDGGTAMDAIYSFTGITEDGNRFIAEHVAANFAATMKYMEESLNHFALYGKLLKKSI